jgi:Protein of unknown function (DUF3224)
MTERATGTFDVTADPQPPFEAGDGVSLARMTITKKFSGDIDGTSVVHLLTVGALRPDSAGYVAVERVVGTLHGRTGSFVLQHLATMDRGEGDLRIVVVPDTGTGELAGLRGTFAIEIADGAHHYAFDYMLDDAA